MAIRTIKKMKKLEQSVRTTAEAFRGVDMEAYTLLLSASDLIQKAIITAEMLTKRQKPPAIPLNTLFNDQA